MLGQIRERRVVLIERNLLRIADLPTPRAEAAVRGAHGTDEEQRAVRIPVCNVRHRRVAVFVQRVNHSVNDLEFLDRRHVLVPHRIANFLDLRQGRRRHAHLEVVERRLERVDVDYVVPEPIRQFLQRIDAFVQDLLPVTHGQRG